MESVINTPVNIRELITIYIFGKRSYDDYVIVKWRNILCDKLRCKPKLKTTGNCIVMKCIYIYVCVCIYVWV